MLKGFINILENVSFCAGQVLTIHFYPFMVTYRYAEIEPLFSDNHIADIYTLIAGHINFYKIVGSLTGLCL